MGLYAEIPSNPCGGRGTGVFHLQIFAPEFGGGLLSGPGSESPVLAVDIGGTKVAIAAVGQAGDILEECQLASRSGSVHELAGQVHQVLGDLSRRHIPVAIGLATVGIVGADGTTAFAANLPGWEAIRLEELLPDPDLPHVVLNDVKAAALAEATMGAGVGAESILYVNFGTGFAAAYVCGGSVWPGAHGAAGEIGYWIGSADQRGARDSVAPLESRIGGWGIAERAAAIGLSSAKAVAESNEPEAKRLWQSVLDEAARTVANIATVLDPERIVLGGGIAQDVRLHDAVAAKVAQFVPFPAPVCLSRLGKRAGLLGAAVRARHAVSSCVSGLQ